jgi:hypothetical protein
MENQEETQAQNHTKRWITVHKIEEVTACMDKLRSRQDIILLELTNDDVEYADEKKDHLRFIEKELTNCQARITALQRNLEKLNDVSNN